MRTDRQPTSMLSSTTMAAFSLQALRDAFFDFGTLQHHAVDQPAGDGMPIRADSVDVDVGLPDGQPVVGAWQSAGS